MSNITQKVTFHPTKPHVILAGKPEGGMHHNAAEAQWCLALLHPYGSHTLYVQTALLLLLTDVRVFFSDPKAPSKNEETG